MKISRSHRYHYDNGAWKETKITPDPWQIYYAVVEEERVRLPKDQAFQPEQDITGLSWRTRW